MVDVAALFTIGSRLRQERKAADDERNDQSAKPHWQSPSVDDSGIEHARHRGSVDLPKAAALKEEKIDAPDLGIQKLDVFSGARFPREPRPCCVG